MITDIRLSISEASKLFGISQRTIRRAITAGALEFMLVQGRYKISFDSLLRWSQTSTLTVQKRDTQGIGQYVSAWKISTAPAVAQAAVTDSVQMTTPRTAPTRTKKVSVAPSENALTIPVAATSAAPTAPIPGPTEPTLSWD